MKSFNAYLDNLQNKVFEAHRQLTEKNDLITEKRLRDQFQGKAEKQRTLIKSMGISVKQVNVLINTLKDTLPKPQPPKAEEKKKEGQESR